jgi:Transglycosylase SLT domain
MRLLIAALVAVVAVSFDSGICFSDDQSVAPATEDQIVASEQIPEPPRKDFCEALKEAAESSDIPVAFFARLLWQESRFNSLEVSHVGAQGVAQFMPGTAAEVGLEDPFDPFEALPASARFLRKLQNQFGNLGLAAAAYNAGSGRIQKWLSRRVGLPTETKDYVRIVTGSSAKNWIEESGTVSLHLELPRGAPCEGVGGLSKAKDVAAIAVVLAPTISDVIKKAEAAARSEAAARETARIARLQERSKTSLKLAHIRSSRKILAVVHHGGTKARTMVVALRGGTHPRTNKVAARSRNVRVASATSR